MFFEIIKKWFFTHVFVRDKTSNETCMLETDSENNEKSIQETKAKSETKVKLLCETIYRIKLNIKSFENIFKEKSEEYMVQAQRFEDRYNSQKEEYELSCLDPSRLSVVLNPEEDLEFVFEVSKLDKEIQNFISNEVKPQIINLRLDKFLEAINKLYFAIRKDVNSRHVQDRIDEATQKFEQITSDTLNDYEKVAIIKNNNVLQDKFYNAKYLIAKIIILTNGVNELETVFLEDENTYYLIQLHKELDILEEKLIKFTDPKYDKLKLDFQRISNLNYLMPSEKVFTSRKFWLDFFDIEKIIYDEEKKMDKKVKSRKAKNNLVDNKNIISALNKSKLVIKVEESDNNCKKFINWVKKIYIDSKELGLAVAIINYIDEDISWNDIYNILTLLEVRHLIKDEIISSIDITVKGLQEIYIKKYTDSYEKLIKNKEAILESVDSYNEFLLMLKINDSSEVMKILENLKIIAYSEHKENVDYVYINSVYFTSSTYFLNVLKTKESQSA